MLLGMDATYCQRSIEQLFLQTVCFFVSSRKEKMARQASEASQKLQEFLELNTDGGGMTGQELADKFGVSVPTVMNIKKKLGIVGTRGPRKVPAGPRNAPNTEVNPAALKEAVAEAGGIERLIEIAELAEKAGGLDAIKSGLEKARMLAEIYLDIHDQPASTPESVATLKNNMAKAKAGKK